MKQPYTDSINVLKQVYETIFDFNVEEGARENFVTMMMESKNDELIEYVSSSTNDSDVFIGYD